MPKLPRVSGAEAIRALEKLGFVRIRQRGSHVVLKRVTESGAIGCVVPLHSELATGTLRGILNQAQVDGETFTRVL
jgi:predicted RNA binding protein YcfA (HicA-like mRNA interferase family)